MSEAGATSASVGDLLRLAVDELAAYALVTASVDTRVTSWNRGAERLFGHQEIDVIGLRLATVLSVPEIAEQLSSEHVHRSVPESAVRTFAVTRADGSVTEVQGMVVTPRTTSGIAGYVVIAHLRPVDAAANVNTSGITPALSPSDSRVLLAAERAERTQAEEARIRLLRRLVMAQEEERRRLARDLHDKFGQQLTALRLILETLRTDRIEVAKLNTALEMLARIDQDVDFIAWELRPAALDDHGLAKVLAAFVDEWARHTGIRARFHSRPGHLDRFAPEVEGSVYRIAQEALNNVAKHAEARSVNVVLDSPENHLLLIVEDDGKGIQQALASGTRIGLSGMKERALALGGTLDIEPTPHGGTTILVRIPTHPTSTTDAVDSMAWASSDSDSQHRLGSSDSSVSDNALGVIRLRVQELQRAVGARDEFIATVAHELRNPIAPLTFQVRLALNKLDQVAASNGTVSRDWVQSQLHGVEKRLHRLLETLDRLLDVSRLSSGRIDLQPEPVNLADVVQEVIGTLDAEIAVARSMLTMTVQGEATGHWDRLRVEQISRNLLSNAIRFGAGSPIEVTVSADSDFAVLRVRDHGMGIPRDQHDQIFERFERGHEQRSGGFGIGLWIVRNICLAMGGNVSVESEIGEGACFTVMLPKPARRASAGGEAESAS